MNTVRLLRIAGVVLLVVTLAGCRDSMPPARTDEVIVQASPAEGFNYPYILRIPRGIAPDSSICIVVEPNNTGAVSDNLNVHMDAARKLAGNSVGAFVSRSLSAPFLVPVFPRPETHWELYTHLLDRDVMLLEDGPMVRLDEQLIAMVENARVRLRRMGIPTEHRVLLTGFSASGTFANRFTMLHPERVRAVATGGVNGLLMLPVARLDDTELRYPIGIADFDTIAGYPFERDAWLAVPQFIYMGAMDDNDAVGFSDGYSDAERETIYRLLGERMQPDRWERCQAAYRDAGANATFRTYDGIGHGTDRAINSEITQFFRDIIEGP